MWCYYLISYVASLKLILLLLTGALSSSLKTPSENASFSCLQGELLSHRCIFKAPRTGLTEGGFRPSQEGRDDYSPDQHSGSVSINQCRGHYRWQVLLLAILGSALFLSMWICDWKLVSNPTSHFASSFMLCIRTKSHCRIWSKSKEVANTHSLLMKRKGHTGMASDHRKNGGIVGKWNP